MARERDPATSRPGQPLRLGSGGTSLQDCPQCMAPAELLARWTWASTDGPVEHVKIRCVLGHWFAMPAWMLSASGGT